MTWNIDANDVTHAQQRSQTNTVREAGINKLASCLSKTLDVVVSRLLGGYFRAQMFLEDISGSLKEGKSRI